MAAEIGEPGIAFGLHLIAVAAQRDFYNLGDDRRPVAQNDDAIPEINGFVDVVGYEKDAHPVLLADLQDQIFKIDTCLRVHRCERLVHDEQFRLVGQSPRNRDTLLHAAG